MNNLGGKALAATAQTAKLVTPKQIEQASAWWVKIL